MTDRNVQFPNRYQLTKVEGTDDIYDLTPAPGTITAEGTMINKSSLLQDITCDVIGIEHTSTPNEAFLALSLGVGRYGYLIHVQYPDGSPAQGFTLTGLNGPDGNTAITNEYGDVVGVSTEQSVTIGIDSPYIDIQDVSGQVIESTGNLTRQTITLQFVDPISGVSITNSTTVELSSYVDSIDITAVGGGGGGGMGASNATGSGGGGGYVQTVTGVQIGETKSIVIQIGAGGVSVSGTSADGGTTSVTLDETVIVTANGGHGGTSTNISHAGGTGNGNGGNAATNASVYNGGNGIGYKFNDSSLGVAGGGGGGGGRDSGTYGIAQGGTPYGGNGGSRWDKVSATSGEGPGGGGGGGFGGGSGRPSMDGGTGGNGAVFMRFHHNGESAA